MFFLLLLFPGCAPSDDQDTLKGHSDKIYSLAFGPGDKILASGGWDGSIIIWDLSKRTKIMTLDGHTDKVSGLVFSADGKILASSSFDKTAKLWDTTTWKIRANITENGSAVHRIALAPDSKALAAPTTAGLIKLWDVPSGKELRELKTHEEVARCVAYSSDGTILASASAKTVQLWDTATWKEIVKPISTGYVESLAFSPDGKTLAIGGYMLIPNGPNSYREGGFVILWDTTTKEEKGVLEEHDQRVCSMAFHPSGKVLATGSADKTIRLWDVANKTELSKQTQDVLVYCVAFSHDGKLLATPSSDNTVKLWETAKLVSDKKLLEK
ncbi:MAG: WD40 repeat domain-containing protein [Gemmataceae bacterium]